MTPKKPAGICSGSGRFSQKIVYEQDASATLARAGRDLSAQAIIPIIAAAFAVAFYGASMLTHAQVWSAIDGLATRAGLSASGLAKRAGLDPTTFNKSKRVTAQGRARWPSTESIAKALSATGTSMDVFVKLIDAAEVRATKAVPLLGFAEAGNGGYFDDGGFPVGEGWDEIAFPAVTDQHAYALEISGQSMQPAYRDGDVILVSPAAPIRRGDRVVVRTRSGEVMAKELKRRTPKAIELRSLNAEHEDRVIAGDDVVWIARILWVSL
jgi:phage repressor protein C with HTH and peptisase S24 domain